MSGMVIPPTLFFFLKIVAVIWGHLWFHMNFFKGFIYLFLEGKGGRKSGRKTSMCGCPSCGPHWGPGPQPRHVPWLGIEPATLGSQPTLNLLSYNSQGPYKFLKCFVELLFALFSSQLGTYFSPNLFITTRLSTRQ